MNRFCVSIILPVIVSALFLAGCSSKKEIPFVKIDSAPENRSVVYFYRPHNIFKKNTYLIRVNGVTVGSLDSKCYLPFQTQPGTLDIELVKGEYPFNTIDARRVIVEDQQVVYLRCGPDNLFDNCRIVTESPGKAEAEISDMIWHYKDA